MFFNHTYLWTDCTFSSPTIYYYGMVKNSQHRAEVEQLWGLTPGQISGVPGRNAWEMIMALERQEIGCLWIAATNPAVSMPDLERTKAALLRLPFTVYQDAYYPTETAEYAHLLLPAAQWGEKTGTMQLCSLQALSTNAPVVEW